MSKPINIFGTKFCVPKGYKMGKGYSVIECSIPLKAPTEHKEKITDHVRIDREIIRDDIERAHKHFGGKFPSEKEFNKFLKKYPSVKSI